MLFDTEAEAASAWMVTRRGEKLANPSKAAYFGSRVRTGTLPPKLRGRISPPPPHIRRGVRVRQKKHWTQTPAGKKILAQRSRKQREVSAGSGAPQAKTIKHLIGEVEDAARLLYHKTNLLNERLKTDLT